MTDEIIKEVWCVKDEIASEFNYDIAALAAYLNKKEQSEGAKKEYPSEKGTPSVLADPREKYE
ncbi:MAG: hypothetical protein JXR76_18195 [Deltaproteobacteria bacterium]|nr:hypothetical protein [Deltaproteobacteria bacterium]